MTTQNTPPRPPTRTIARLAAALALPLAALSAGGCGDLVTQVHRVPEDHATIQAAIDAADGADIVSIAPGVYHERLTIDYTPYLTVRGKGDVVIDAGGAVNGVHATGNFGLKLRGLRITNAAQAGLRLDDCSEVRVQECTIDAVDRFGLHVLDSMDVRITDSIVRETEIAGIYLDDTRPPTDVLIDGCEVRDAGRHGVFLHGDQITVRRTRISDVTNNGVVNRALDALIEGVHVARSGGEGMLSTAADTTFRRCRVEDVTYSGYTTTQPGAVFDRCIADDVGLVGFSAQGDTARLIRCRVERTGLAGYQLLGDDSVVKRCRVRAAGVLRETGSDSASLFIRGDRAVATGCRIADAAGDGIRVDGSDTLLRGNKLQRIARFGIRLTTGGNEVLKNRLKRCDVEPIRDDRPGENLVERNKVDARR